MQLQLLFSNTPRTLPALNAFVRETLRQYPFDGATADKLAQCIFAAAENAIAHAYPDGEAGEVKLRVTEENGKLEFRIRDYGLPQDVAALERRLHDPAQPAGVHSLAWPGLEAVDEIHWIGFGREGKAIQIIKWLHDNHIADGDGAATLTPFNAEAPLAPPQEYEIRRMRPEEAVQVSQLMYRAYGNTYLNEDVYYPDRVAAQDAAGTVISFVAVGAGGVVVGHYALERGVDGPVVEGGQAVVDPSHRSRGLLDRMKEAALAEAARLELLGWFADAVAVHTRTQQSNISHGGHLCCADLAIAPRTQQFRNISTDLPQRITCLMFFHWLTEPLPRTIFVPQRHQSVVAEIYAKLGAPATFGPASEAAGHGAIRISIAATHATIRAELLGGDTAHQIRHAKREIVERSHAEVVYAELPLSDPATPSVAEALEEEGFGFLGVAPCHALAGDDLLRLAYLVEPLQREPIKTADEFCGRLVDYALAEQQRVQASL
ncbi:ATP-binding protein [Lacipirellula sp.]|uniref:ATP-binding protein n=1 Tax=Lacipirellula sp. TaxID=2691419 RepID=UPI003D0FC382